MFNQRRPIFRKASLERLSSPERLDELMQVVAPKDWLALVAIGGLMVCGIGWSIWGKIPITVTGRGVLVYPYQVEEIQVPASGRLQALKVKVGDRVRQGEVLGVIDQSDLRQQLQQQRLKLTELKTQGQQVERGSREQVVAELRVLQQQRQVLQQRLQNMRELSPASKTQEWVVYRQQRQALQQKLQDAQLLAPLLHDRWESRKKLQAEGAIAADAVLQAEREYRETTAQIASLQAQLADLHQRELAIEREDRDRQNQMADLQAQLEELTGKANALRQQTLESGNVRFNQIREVERTIAQLTQQLQRNGQILSPYSGRVVELSLSPGQMVGVGSRLGTVQTDTPTRTLTSLIYLPIKDGKQMQPGMTVQITPDHVRREEYGGLLGNVQSISNFPMTRQGMVAAIGNTELAEGLTIRGGQIQVIATLQPDSTMPSGYRWSSSSGPALQLSPGTTVSVRVTISEQAPIALIMPLLRSATGLN